MRKRLKSRIKALPVGRQGFTLIELLLVMAILGILIAMGLASYMSSLQKGRDSKRKNDVRQVGVALELYFADKGKYPLGDVNGQIVGCGSPATACAWGTAFTDGVTLYMTQLPQDAIGTQRDYYVSSDGTYFQLYTRLENTKDSDIPQSGGKARVFTNTNCGTATSIVHCNYGTSSTNKSVTDGQATSYE